MRYAPFVALALLAGCYPVVPVTKTLVLPDDARYAVLSRVVPGSRLRLFRDGAGTMDAYFVSVRPDTLSIGIRNDLYAIPLRHIDSAWVRTENLQTGMAIGSAIGFGLGSAFFIALAGTVGGGSESVLPAMVVGGGMGSGIGAAAGMAAGAIHGGRWKPLFSVPARSRSRQ